MISQVSWTTRQDPGLAGTKPHLAGYATSELMFPSPGGRHLRRSNFARRVFKPLMVEAGLESDNTFHSLRKTYATMLAELGATPGAQFLFNIFEAPDKFTQF